MALNTLFNAFAHSLQCFHNDKYVQTFFQSRVIEM